MRLTVRFEIIDDCSSFNAGTINLIIFINRELTPAALTDCVMTATEAKAAVLQELGIYSSTFGFIGHWDRNRSNPGSFSNETRLTD